MSEPNEIAAGYASLRIGELEKENERIKREEIGPYQCYWRDRALLAEKRCDEEGCILIRCLNHLTVPQQNKNEASGAECGACIAAERDALKAELATSKEQFEREMNHLREVRARFVMNHLERICGECGHDKDEDGKCATCMESELATIRTGSAQLAADLDACKRERDAIRDEARQYWVKATEEIATALVEVRKQLAERAGERDAFRDAAMLRGERITELQRQLTEKSALCEMLKELVRSVFEEGFNQFACQEWTLDDAWAASNSLQLLQRAEAKSPI